MAEPRARRTGWLVLARFRDLVADPRGSIADDITPGVDHRAVRRVAGTAVIGGLTGRAGDRADREGAQQAGGHGNAPSAAVVTPASVMTPTPAGGGQRTRRDKAREGDGDSQLLEGGLALISRSESRR